MASLGNGGSEREDLGFFWKTNSTLHTPRKDSMARPGTEVTVPGGDLGSQGRAPALRGSLGPGDPIHQPSEEPGH